MTELSQGLFEYHQRSKHRVNHYAPGPAGLDWANQPDPFREFPGAAQLKLPLAADSLVTRYNELRRGDLPPACRFDLGHLAILFELSLGLSAWKSYGANRWALRCNPSSGNLHPTESYLLCPHLPGLPAGIYHYLSRDHVLEQRAAVDDPHWTGAFSGNGILIGISSIYWREAWKYGMRAWRYCQHDCGHAIAAVSYAAAALGWQTRLVVSAADDVVANLLGLDRSADFESAEREAPDALLWVGDPDARPDLARLLDPLSKARWHGRANRLSQEHVRWPDIDSIHRITHKPLTQEPAAPAPIALPPPAPPALDLSFAEIARQRRSAVDFDGTTGIPAAAFFAMLECLMVRARCTALECVAGSRARASCADGAPRRWPGAGSVYVPSRSGRPPRPQAIDAPRMAVAEDRTRPSAPVSIVALRFARHGQVDLLPPGYRRRLLFCAGDACEVRSRFA